MRLRFVFLVLLVIWSLGFGTSASHAVSAGYTDDPLKISIGARAMGMGGALAAVSDGSSNIFNNPAGMVGQETQLSSMYTSLLGDVNYTVAGGNWPVSIFKRQGNMGIGFAGSTVGGIVDPDPTGFKYFDYHNNVWLLAYGEKTRLFGRDSKVALRLKYFEEGFTGSQTDYGRGYNLDAGMIFTPWDKTDIGLMLQNFLLSSLGSNVTWASGGVESVPKQVRIGIASRRWRPNVLLAADVDAYINRPAYPARLHGGIEWQIVPALALRGGFDQAHEAGGVSTSPTFGTGLRIGCFAFDYAYHPYFGFSDATTHYFSLSFVGKEVKAVEAPKVVIAPTSEVIVPTPEAIVPTPEVTAPAPEAKAPLGMVIKEKLFHYFSAGDTLNNIALKYYGEVKFAKPLARYNKLRGMNYRGRKYIYIAPVKELEPFLPKATIPPLPTYA
jgi:hypothetical protein